MWGTEQVKPRAAGCYSFGRLSTQAFPPKPLSTAFFPFSTAALSSSVSQNVHTNAAPQSRLVASYCTPSLAAICNTLARHVVGQLQDKNRAKREHVGVGHVRAGYGRGGYVRKVRCCGTHLKRYSPGWHVFSCSRVVMQGRE